MLLANRIIRCTVIKERRQDGERHHESNVEQCKDVDRRAFPRPSSSFRSQLFPFHRRDGCRYRPRISSVDDNRLLAQDFLFLLARAAPELAAYHNTA
jgi:hypothetical protein